MSETTRYPLCWPAGWKRTPAAARRPAAFGRTRNEYNAAVGRTMYRGKQELSVWDAIQRLDGELRVIDAERSSAVISTNIPTRIDGAPRSGMREPDDPGAAVYWERKGRKECMAIDRYTRVADNIAAIAATLEALRAIERHGGGAILDRAFAGFAQLPAAIVTERPWREVLGLALAATMEDVERQFRALAKQLHPDVSDDDGEKMRELNRAREAAKRELVGEAFHA